MPPPILYSGPKTSPVPHHREMTRGFSSERGGKPLSCRSKPHPSCLIRVHLVPRTSGSSLLPQNLLTSLRDPVTLMFFCYLAALRPCVSSRWGWVPHLQNSSKKSPLKKSTLNLQFFQGHFGCPLWGLLRLPLQACSSLGQCPFLFPTNPPRFLVGSSPQNNGSNFQSHLRRVPLY